MIRQSERMLVSTSARVSAIILIGLIGSEGKALAGEKGIPAESCAVISRRNGMACDMREGGTTPLTLVQLADLRRQKNREFEFVPIKPGVYAVKALHCGSYWDIRGRGPEGARLQLGDQSPNQDNRHFIVRRSPNMYYTLAAEHSDLLLDVFKAGGWKAEIQTAGHPNEVQTNREWLVVPWKLLDEQELFTYDNRLYYRVKMSDLKAELQGGVKEGTIEIVGVGEGNNPGGGGLRCKVSNKEWEGSFVLEPRSGPTKPELHVHVELLGTRAFDPIVELGKMLTNADQEIRKTLIPPIEAEISEKLRNPKELKQLPGVKIEVIGFRDDGMVLVSNWLPDETIWMIDLYIQNAIKRR